MADLAEIREYFLGFLRRDARILDFGCGSGRDAKAFAEAGRIVEALDGSQELWQDRIGISGNGCP